MIRLLSLILLCLMLCGCGAEAGTAAPQISSDALLSDSLSEDYTLYLPDSDLERLTVGAVTVHPMTIPDCTGLRAFGSRLLLFSGEETTILTILEGEPLSIAATTELSFFLRPDDPSVRMGIHEFSYYDRASGETVVMSSRLQPIRRIRAPQELIGSPILSDDGNTLFYCTSDALRVWDLESGIRRILKEMPCTGETLTALHAGSTVLQCTDADQLRMSFLSAEDGRLLQETDALALSTHGSSYSAVLSEGGIRSVVFGQAGQVPSSLHPEESAVWLPQGNTVVGYNASSEKEIVFSAYDLSSGHRISSLTLPSQEPPLAVERSSDGSIWILMYSGDYGTQTLYRWKPEQLPCHDDTVYSGSYYTRENPDTDGLAQCSAEARRLSEKYGIRIRIWDDAAAVQPWDYDFRSEYLVPVLQKGLELLDQQLAEYPREVLEETASHFSSLSICLVRQITGSAESGSLDTATGIQFLDGTDAFVVIALGQYAEQALYHELFHVMETHILTNSIAFDRWDQLNPAGFSYDYSYLTNAGRDSGVYLQKENRAFLDTYSMSFPKEDRARIFEYAMLPDNQALFTSPILQAKLRTICDGIREAYQLEDQAIPFLWEQYLD